MQTGVLFPCAVLLFGVVAFVEAAESSRVPEGKKPAPTLSGEGNRKAGAAAAFSEKKAAAARTAGKAAKTEAGLAGKVSTKSRRPTMAQKKEIWTLFLLSAACLLSVVMVVFWAFLKVRSAARKMNYGTKSLSVDFAAILSEQQRAEKEATNKQGTGEEAGKINLGEKADSGVAQTRDEDAAD